MSEQGRDHSGCHWCLTDVCGFVQVQADKFVTFCQAPIPVCFKGQDSGCHRRPGGWVVPSPPTHPLPLRSNYLVEKEAGSGCCHGNCSQEQGREGVGDRTSETGIFQAPMSDCVWCWGRWGAPRANWELRPPGTEGLRASVGLTRRREAHQAACSHLLRCVSTEGASQVA